jgi:heme/copper-type cytochrome/quinol oxidase subunit 3
MSDLTAVVAGVAKTEKAKVIVGYFLASEFVFFSFLITAYVDFQSSAISAGPTASSSLHPGITGIYTAFLLGSSPTMWWAAKMYREGRRTAFQIWLAITMLFGAIFLYGEGKEYYELVSKGITLGANAFGTTFFTLTGFHAFHLIVGLTLMSIFWGVFRGQGAGGHKRHAAMECVSMYWHFVDGMWVIIFTVIYLWSASA